MISVPTRSTGSGEASSSLFIETTAWVDVVIGDRIVRERIENKAAGRELWSSQYVRMEVYRTAVHALQVVRELISLTPRGENPFASPLDAITRYRDGRGRLLKPRQRERCLQALRSTMNYFKHGLAPRRAVIAWLDTTIDQVKKLELLTITMQVDSTDCDLVQPLRKQSVKWPPSCAKAEAECRQCVFLDRERTSLQAILDACSLDADFKDKNALAALTKAVRSTKMDTSGQSTCWPLGDVINALEARQAGAILTSNVRDFAPICAAIGLTLETYSTQP